MNDHDYKELITRPQEVWSLEELCQIYGFLYKNNRLQTKICSGDMTAKTMFKGYKIGKQIIPNFDDTSLMLKLVFFSSLLREIFWKGRSIKYSQLCESNILVSLKDIYNPLITFFQDDVKIERSNTLYFCLSQCGRFVLKRQKPVDMEVLRYIEARCLYLKTTKTTEHFIIDTIINNPNLWLEQGLGRKLEIVIDWKTWKKTGYVFDKK